MALTRPVSFRTVLEKGNSVQVRRMVRWQFKLETDQVLRVSVRVVGSLRDWERFYAKMRSDGRLTVSKLPLDLLQDRSINTALEQIGINPNWARKIRGRKVKGEEARSIGRATGTWRKIPIPKT